MAKYQYPAKTTSIPMWVRISVNERETRSAGPGGQEVEVVDNFTDNIYLYMPSAVSFSDGLAFENVEFNNLVTTLVGGTESNKSLGPTVGEALKNYFQNAVTDKSGLGGLTGGAASLVARNLGRVRNPRTEMLFKSPALRQFTLAFKLMPENAKESNEIYNIIQTIRAASYPEIIADGTAFAFPKIFRISFVSFSNQENPKMIKFADAYCTSITTNYNPTNPAFFDDGSPHEVDLNVTFQETEVIDRAKVLEGY